MISSRGQIGTLVVAIHFWLLLSVPTTAREAEIAAKGDEVSVGASVPDRIIVLGRFDRLVSEASGGAAGLSWLTTGRAADVLEVGVYSNHIGETSWHYGRLGLFERRGRASLSGSLELGGGDDGDDRFLYLTSRVGADFALVPRRLSIGGGLEFLDVNRAMGVIGKASLSWHPSPSIGLSSDYRHTLTNGLAVEQFLGRADVALGRWRVLGGLSAGTFVAQELLVIDLDTGRQNEWFAGVGLPIGGNELTVVWSTLASNAVTRHSVTAGVLMSIGGTTKP